MQEHNTSSISLSQMQCPMNGHQLCPTGRIPPQISGTMWNTSATLVPTTRSMTWPEHSSPISIWETRWVMTWQSNINTKWMLLVHHS